MKRLLSFCLGGLLFLAPLLVVMPSAPARAQAAADHYTVPLMVIRFNQPRVYFEKSLHSAVAKALRVKPNVYINVVNYFPTLNERAVDKAENNLNSVVRALNKMGMPLERIGVTSEPASDLGESEVHIYVR